MIYTVTLNPAIDRELTVPAILFDEVLRASELRVDCGGKGFNVSRMLASLDVESVALGFAGGKSGEMLQQGLNALGIQPDFVWIPGETRTNVSIVTTDHQRYVKVNEAGPTVTTDERVALIEKIRHLARADDWWVLAGSLPPGVPPTFYAQIIREVQTAGAHAILDSSGDALRHGCQAGPFLAKPNATETGQLTGMPVSATADIIAAAHAVRALGVRNVVISLGQDGALLVDEKNNWLVSAPNIQERNPIGAGDSMVAGLVWRLSLGDPLPQAGRWGVACGAATASQSGTAVGSYTLVASLVSQVEATVLAVS